MGVTKKKAFKRRLEAFFFVTTTEDFNEYIVARSADEGSAVRGTFAKGNIEVLNGMPPQGATVLL